MIPQTLPLIRSKPDLPAFQRLRVQPAPRQIIPRRTGSPGLQLQPEKLHRLLHHFGQLRALVGFLLRARVLLWHRHPGLAGQNLDRLHETHILGLAHKGNRIALGMTAKAIIESLAVIDVKTGGFLLMERARCPHIALALIGLARIPHDFTPHHLRQAGTASQFI